MYWITAFPSVDLIQQQPSTEDDDSVHPEWSTEILADPDDASSNIGLIMVSLLLLNLN